MDIRDKMEDMQKGAFVAAEGGHHLRLTDLLKLSVRVFRVRPLRTFLTILGISLGIGAVLFLVSLGYGLQFILIGKLASTEDSLVTLEAFYPGESVLTIGAKDIQTMSAEPEVAEVSPLAEFTGEVKTDAISGFLTVKLADDGYFRLSGLKPDIGSTFSAYDKGVVVSDTALTLLGVKPEEAIGKQVSIKVFYQDANETSVDIAEVPGTLPIVGVVKDEFQPPFVLMPASAVAKKPPFYQKVFVKAGSIETVEPLRDKLIERGFLISARVDLVNQARKILNVITIVLGVFGVTALVVSAIGMFNTMIIGFMERIFEVGIMKSIGATKTDIRNLFLMESLIMGLLGGVGGITVGFLSGQLFNLGLNILAKHFGGKPVDLFIYPVKFLLFILLLSGLVGIASGFWPARRAATLSPKEAFIRK